MPEVTQSSSTVTSGSNREETCDSGNQQGVQSTSGGVSFLFFKEIGYTQTSTIYFSKTQT